MHADKPQHIIMLNTAHDRMFDSATCHIQRQTISPIQVLGRL